MNSDWPTNEPMLTNLLIRKLVKEQRERPELEHAFDTLLRHSDAAGCARKLGLKMAGYQAGEPMDASGVWVTFLGSLIHEQVQAAILEAYPDAEIEAKVRWDDLSASGHCDALIRLPSGWTGRATSSGTTPRVRRSPPRSRGRSTPLPRVPTNSASGSFPLRPCRRCWPRG